MALPKKETLKIINKLQRQNKKILMYRIYKFGEEILRQALHQEDIVDFDTIIYSEVERLSKRADKICFTIPHLKSLVEEDRITGEGFEDAFYMNLETEKKLDMKKEYQSLLEILEDYKQKESRLFFEIDGDFEE